MVCCWSRDFPKQFHEIPEYNPAQANVAEADYLTSKIEHAKARYQLLPPTYNSNPVVRFLVIAAVAAAIGVASLALSGTLLSFPEQLTQFFQNINLEHLSMGIGVLTVLTAGAAIVIHQALHRKDRVIDAEPGKLTGNSHWVSAYYTTVVLKKTGSGSCSNCDASQPNAATIVPITCSFPGYIDTSTLDSTGTGAAFMYIYKDEANHMSVAAEVLAFTPLHMVAAMAYNTIRAVVVPFFILGCIVVEKIRDTGHKPTDPNYRKKPFQDFCLRDIPIEIGKSLWGVIKAPFYATAIMFAALYAFVDPLNGRKLGSIMARRWNHKVTRAEGFWSVQGAQSLWKFEGGGSPDKLGDNGFYLEGCWQPIAVVNYKDGRMEVEADSLSRAVSKGKGHVYQITTADHCIEIHNAAVEAFKILIVKEKGLQDSQEASEGSS